MKKIITIIAVVALFAFQSNLKAQAFENGSMVANAGLGFGWYSYGSYGGATSFPAISLSLEKGVKDLDFGVLSIGGIVGYKHTTWASAYSYDWGWTDFIIAARGAVHVDLLHNEKVDTYGGLGVGLRFESWKYNDYLNKKYTESTTHPLIAFYVGGRYYFTDKLAGFGELGYGLGYFTIGLSYKLK